VKNTRASTDERRFKELFIKAGKGTKLWLQNGHPSQNSTLARAAWRKIKARLLSIPPQSPDINPIENIFNIVKRILQSDALKNNITYESFQDFSRRVKSTINNLDKKLIDQTIESMQKRMHLIIAKNGGRTKY